MTYFTFRFEPRICVCKFSIFELSCSKLPKGNRTFSFQKIELSLINYEIKSH